MASRWADLEALGDILEALEASWRRLGGVLESVLEALEVVLEAMLSQDSS